MVPWVHPISMVGVAGPDSTGGVWQLGLLRGRVLPAHGWGERLRCHLPHYMRCHLPHYMSGRKVPVRAIRPRGSCYERKERERIGRSGA
jgi:hypothetical protein